MPVLTCETCRWWTTRFKVRVDCIGSVGTEVLHLGYCEPPPFLHRGASGHWKGLTAADYSCGEHQERPDAD